MKKSISFILVMLMVLCMVPSVALATEYVAEIGSNRYTSIQAAVDAAENGDTIVITKSHTVDCSKLKELQPKVYSAITVADKTVTIDLNGKTVDAKSPDNVDVTSPVGADVKLFILISSTGSGNLTLEDSMGGGAVICNKNGSPVYDLLCAFNDTSYITVESGHYELDYASDNLIYAAGNETVTINGGTFYLGNVGDKGSAKNYQPWIFNAQGQNERHINVNGGTFNAEVNNQYWIFEAQMPRDKALIDNGNDTWTVVDAVAYVNAREWSNAWYTYEVGYTTLADAVNAVRPNRQKTSGSKTYDSGPEDVGLVTDCDVSNTLTVKEDFTLELNNNTIIWTGDGTAPMFTVEDDNVLTVADFTPLRTGYTFGGWYTNEARTSPYDLANEGKVAEGTSLYAKWSPAPISSISSGYSGPDLWYIGGNTFVVTTSTVPTSVEIDGVPVSFTMNGNQITVGCIQPGSDWVTVRWGSVSNQRSFTPDANAYCTQTVIPKTGDMSLWAAIVQFFGF